MDGCVLSIAHRLTTIKDSDTIVVMKDGKCVEHGTHEELMVR
jgi:ABC-type multidrug transport system fused ATPase/permease subunit